VEVWGKNDTKQFSVHSTGFLHKGENILTFGAAGVYKEASYLTIQINHEEHISLNPGFLQYTNHSCNPNIFYNMDTMQVQCIEPIQPGDELMFFYPSTEWEMAQPFICNCGNTNCLQLISGAVNLPENTLHKYRFNNHILQQLKTRI
jgi:hypothetical protein